MKILNSAWLLLILAGCGGGGSSTSSTASATTSTAEGLWTGTTSNGRTATGIVMDDGTTWFLYSKAGNSTVLGGAVQGSGTSSNGSFSSSNAKDFNLEGLGTMNATISASYVAKQSLNGSISYPSGVVSFTSNYDATYELTPSIANITGAYSGLSYGVGGGEVATLTISTSGNVTGSTQSGCNYSGTVTPHAKGNIYDVSITFGGGVCVLGTSQANGVVYLSTSKVLYSMGLNSSRTNGFIFAGTK